MAASTSIQQISCWTCRLRKKKCDRRRPVCEACAALRITCHTGHDRPEWMDNGDRQASMANTIRAQIKQAAEHRRPNSYIQVSALQTSYAFGMSAAASGLAIIGSDGSDGVGQDGNSISSSEEARTKGSAGTAPSSTSTSMSSRQPTKRKAGHISDGRPRLDALTLEDMETDFTAMYLDHAFPFLFPHYHPTVFEGGRSWLVATLKHSRALFHTALSLAVYFLTLYAQAVDPTAFDPDDTCARYVWELLAGHMDNSVRAIQEDVAALRGGHVETAVSAGVAPTGCSIGPPTPPQRTTTAAAAEKPEVAGLLHRARTMESIIQLQVFESAVARTVGDWDAHLVAAAALFEEIFDTYGVDAATHQPSLGTIMAAMERPVALVINASRYRNRKRPGPCVHLWNTDQGAFRFFACVLLYMDVIASTVLRVPPRLQRYHQHLIYTPAVKSGSEADDTVWDDDAEDRACRLQMEGILGCEGWVFVLIGEIAALDAWKKAHSDDGTLAARGQVLATRLDEGLRRIDAAAACPEEVQGVAGAPALQAYYYRQHSNSGAKQRDQLLATRVWVHAARLYLTTVVSGWALEDPTIRDEVATVLQILQQDVATPAVLRSLAWPLCVAGCLASEAEEPAFRALFTAAGALRAFGGLVTASGIMQRVWQLRAQISADATWNLAQCAAVLEYKVLLM